MKTNTQKGFTLVEVMIASLLVAIVTLFIGNFLINSFDNNLSVQTVADLSDLSQTAVNRMKSEVSQSRRLFDGSDQGKAYFSLLEFPSNQVPHAGSKQFVIVDQGSLAPSKAEDFQKPFVREAFGNVLFFAKHQPSLVVQEEKRMVDLYRFVVFFLSEKPAEKFDAKNPSYLDLIRCQSAPFADLNHVQDIADEPVRNAVLRKLEEEQVAALWDAQAPAEVAFTKLDFYKPGKNPEVRFPIKLETCFSQVPGMGKVARALGRVMYSVAFNKMEKFPIQREVPLYAEAKYTDPMFPNGFEVAVVGPKAGRQVLLRLVLAAPLRRDILSRESTILATVKDT